MSGSGEIRFTLNGVTTSVPSLDPKRSVLDVFRDELGLTTLKPGCAPQGICGCCVAIVDGKPRVTCTLAIKTLQGKHVVTQEGMTQAESAAMARAFVETGGTQCGYCTPGIAMQAKALVDRDGDPSEDTIRGALGMHVCRCTGWVKVVDAIRVFARERRSGEARATSVDDGVGGTWRQHDLKEAVVGRRPVIGDMTRPDLLHAALVFTPHARCRVDAVDLTAARAVPGFVDGLTGADVTGRMGILVRDWPVLVGVGEETRCVADVLAVVAAETAQAAKKARDAVMLGVTPLEPVTDLGMAAREDRNVLSTTRVRKGDPETALSRCAHVIEETFHTQRVEPAFLEAEACLVVPLGSEGFRIYSQGQGVFEDRRQLAALTGLEPDRLVVESIPTGGGFGGKEDLTVQAHALLLARKTGRPVRLVLGMEDSTRIHAKRHPFQMRYTVGADADGRLQVLVARILGDTGGYASVGAKVLERAAGHAAGAYHVPHVDVEAKAILTNNPVSGAMRGFGVPQVTFAMEGCIDRLADRLGLDPLELRRRNLLRPGDRFTTGQVMDETCTALATLEALAPHYEQARAAGKHVGVACGMKNVGLGNGARESGRVVLEVRSAREVRLHTGFMDMGQGTDTALAVMAAEATGIPASQFEVRCSTEHPVDSGMTTASRTILLAGNAIRQASERFVRSLDEVDGDLGSLVGRTFPGEWKAPETVAVGAPDPVTHFAYSFGAQLAIVDAEGRLEEIVAAQDVGRAIHPIQCEGQVEGGVHMGIGYALSEELVTDAQGMPDLRLRSFQILKARNMPRITTLLLELADPKGPWGAKGVGEIGVVPTAPAIAEAVRRFDGRWRNRLPMKDCAAAKALGVR